MKVLKCLGFFILAAIVFVGFVYPFSVVPKLYEQKARDMANARVEKGSLVVSDNYINDSVDAAVKDNLDSIFETSFRIAAAVALVVFCLSIRPPHDCGGINYFNPIGLVTAGIVTVLTALTVGLMFRSFPGDSSRQFLFLVNKLTNNLSFSDHRLFLMLIVPAVLEAVFRGVIFSYLEKIHFSVGVILSTFLYGIAVYLIVGSYVRWVPGTEKAVNMALAAALVIGFSESMITWQLRSGIPAVLSHIFIAWSAGYFSNVASSGSLSFAVAVILLVLSLGLLVFVHTFLSNSFRVFAYDFPLEKHHRWMEGWFSNKQTRKKSTAKKTEKSEKKNKNGKSEKAKEPAAKKPASKKPDKPAEKKQLPSPKRLLLGAGSGKKKEGGK